jgi:hypothetical protein
MRTLKQSALVAAGLAAGVVGFAAFGLGVEMRDVVRFGTVAAVGLGAIGVWAMRLPAWARTRREQMAAIAARVSASLREGGAGEKTIAGPE